MLSVDATDFVDIQGAADFAFGQKGLSKDVFFDTITPSGTQWDLGEWGDFYWGTGYTDYIESYVNGHGENIAITISSTSATQVPYTLKDITFIYQPMRIEH